MKNKLKKIISLLLCLTLLSGSILSVYAEPENKENTESENNTEAEVLPEPELLISTVEEFLAFSKKCQLDTYSKDLVVALEKDLDLSDVEFDGIPTFGGVFLGNNHKITGLQIDANGSYQGFFRYIQADAVVRDLTIEGDILPQGSRSYVGAVAGHNAGLVTNCHFAGNIAGIETIGGIVGYNALTGIVEECGTVGNIHGDHFVGGLVGENNGVIRNCKNAMFVNTTELENSVEISDITLETLLNSESVATTTDVGGIAGSNCGVIRRCFNEGNVGYRQIGYNIGGIAGCQMGYIVDCENTAPVAGRKEVGGIVGQMEPATKLEYEKDTLQILQGDLSIMADLTDKAAGDAQDTSDILSGQMSEINTEAEKAGESIDILMKAMEGEEVDPDTVLAARNNLSGSISSISGTTEEMLETGQQASDTMTGHIEAISEQIRVISTSIGNAADNLGAEVHDVSDEDTAEDFTGKIENCVNYATVMADITVGGIVGSIAMESDLDPEADIDIVGETSLNSEIKLRAVILGCKNRGKVECKKQYAGGVAGQTMMGLIKLSDNTGDVLAEAADYVGGIAGSSRGYVRSCYVKGTITGATYVGGLLGTGLILSDSYSMVKVTGTEKVGQIIGYIRNHEDITENYYFCATGDKGGIDGICYDGIANSLSKEEFFALETQSDIFQTVQITFICEDGEVITTNVAVGTYFSTGMIPQTESVDNRVAIWEGVDECLGKELLFDHVFYEQHLPYKTVLESEETRENGLAILLVEGTFLPDATMRLKETIVAPKTSKRETLIEGFTVILPESEGEIVLRYLPNEDEEIKNIKIVAYNKNGTWRETKVNKVGSYYVFDMQKDETAFYVLSYKSYKSFIIGAGMGLVTLGVIAGGVHLVRKRKKHVEV